MHCIYIMFSSFRSNKIALDTVVEVNSFKIINVDYCVKTIPEFKEPQIMHQYSRLIAHIYANHLFQEALNYVYSDLYIFIGSLF